MGAAWAGSWKRCSRASSSRRRPRAGSATRCWQPSGTGGSIRRTRTGPRCCWACCSNAKTGPGRRNSRRGWRRSWVRGGGDLQHAAKAPRGDPLDSGAARRAACPAVSRCRAAGAFTRTPGGGGCTGPAVPLPQPPLDPHRPGRGIRRARSGTVRPHAYGHRQLRPTFGGGGVLVFRGEDGQVRGFRFDGPGARDTVEAELPDMDSVLVWGRNYSPRTGHALVSCVPPHTANREVCLREGGGTPGRRVTANEGDDIPIGWSPDGEWALIGSDEGTAPGSYNYDIYAMHLASGQRVRSRTTVSKTARHGRRTGAGSQCWPAHPGATRSTSARWTRAARRGTASTEPSGYPWAPDGSALLVVEMPSQSRDESKLYLVRPGDAPMPLSVTVPHLEHAIWSPDGAHIVLNGLKDGARTLVICRPMACSSADSWSCTPIGRAPVASGSSRAIRGTGPDQGRAVRPPGRRERACFHAGSGCGRESSRSPLAQDP